MEVLAQIKSLLSENTCIVGMGNYFKSDDAVGLYIVDQLAEKIEAENLGLLNVEDVIESYVFKIAEMECNNVMIVDAVKADSAAGSIVFGRLKEFDEVLGGFSTHKLSLRVSGKILEEYNKKTYLLGVVVDNIDFGSGLSPEVKNSADLLKDFIIKSIAKEKELIHECC